MEYELLSSAMKTSLLYCLKTVASLSCRASLTLYKIHFQDMQRNTQYCINCCCIAQCCFLPCYSLFFTYQLYCLHKPQLVCFSVRVMAESSRPHSTMCCLCSYIVSCLVLPSVSFLHFPVIEQQVVCWLAFKSAACWMPHLCKTINMVMSILLPSNKRKSQWFGWRYKLILARLDHFFVSQHVYIETSLPLLHVFSFACAILADQLLRAKQCGFNVSTCAIDCPCAIQDLSKSGPRIFNMFFMQTSAWCKITQS